MTDRDRRSAGGGRQPRDAGDPNEARYFGGSAEGPFIGRTNLDDGGTTADIFEQAAQSLYGYDPNKTGLPGEPIPTGDFVYMKSDTGEVRLVPRMMVRDLQRGGWRLSADPTVVDNQSIVRTLRGVMAQGVGPGEQLLVDSVYELGEQGGRPFYEAQWRVVGNDGSTRRTGAIKVDNTGKPGTFSALPDPTERQAEAATALIDQAFPVYPAEEVRGLITETQIQTNAARQSNWRAITQALAQRIGADEAVRWVTAVRDTGGAPNTAAESVAEAASTLAQRNPDLARDFIEAEAPGTALIEDTATEIVPTTQQDDQMDILDFINSMLNSGGGGGGGSRTVRQYVPPDRREVEDLVRGMLAGLVGQADRGLVKSYADLYMSEDRAAFDRQDGRSPKASVLARIRGQADYKRIHKLRPDAVDETDWVTRAQGAAMAAGMSAQRAAQFGITQATVGSTQEDVANAVVTQEYQRTGRKRPEFFDRFSQTASAMIQGVR